MKKIDLRKEAKGRPCTIQIYGVCNRNPETSVLCHLPGPGMGVKADDIHAAIGCSACHDVIDGRVNIPSFGKTDRYHSLLEAVIRTQKIWLKEGLMQCYTL